LIASWAATPSTWLSTKPVPACTSVAAPPAIAIGQSSATSLRPITSSITCLERNGMTAAQARLNSMRRRPNESRPRCATTSADASRHASERRTIFRFFSGSFGGLAAGEWFGPASLIGADYATGAANGPSCTISESGRRSLGCSIAAAFGGSSSRFPRRPIATIAITSKSSGTRSSERARS